MKESFTAANALPYKVARDTSLTSQVMDGRIPPVHVQFIPTNLCNLTCSFCSCEKRDRSQVMELDEVESLAGTLYGLGCEAVTITGGGEPLLHPGIQGILQAFDAYGIQIGLVTNGTQFHRLKPSDLARLTWCRISASDERALDTGILPAVESAPNVDWAFSYVLSEKPDIINLADHFVFAEAHDFTHVRVVADLLHPESVAMESARSQVDSRLAIWQPRTEFTPGMRACRISLLKPVIGPDGSVYPCCGVQYATEPMSLDLTPSMSMGHWRDLGRMDPFDGSGCVRCYYADYNRLLGALQEDMEHEAFV